MLRNLGLTAMLVALVLLSNAGALLAVEGLI